MRRVFGRCAAALRRLFGRVPLPRKAPPPTALDAICAKFACTYERSVFPTGEVQVRLLRPDATLSATGLTTADAVAKVCAKATLCWDAL